MTPISSRRSVLLGGAAAATLTQPGAAAAPDAKLVSLLAAWRKNMTEHAMLAEEADAVEGDPAEEERVLHETLAVFAENRSLEEQIAETPATTLEGLRVKATVSTFDWSDNCASCDILSSLLQDLRSLGAIAS